MDKNLEAYDEKIAFDQQNQVPAIKKPSEVITNGAGVRVAEPCKSMVYFNYLTTVSN